MPMTAPRLAPSTGLLPGTRNLTKAATATNAVTLPTSPSAAAVAAKYLLGTLRRPKKKNDPSAKSTPAKAQVAASEAARIALLIGVTPYASFTRTTCNSLFAHLLFCMQIIDFAEEAPLYLLERHLSRGNTS
jgi:hypothetical protein